MYNILEIITYLELLFRILSDNMFRIRTYTFIVPGMLATIVVISTS